MAPAFEETFSLALPFAYLKTEKATDTQFITDFFANGRKVLLNGQLAMFDKALVYQTDALLKLLHLAFDDFLHSLSWLVLKLLGSDLLLLGDQSRIHLLTADR